MRDCLKTKNPNVNNIQLGLIDLLSHLHRTRPTKFALANEGGPDGTRTRPDQRLGPYQGGILNSHKILANILW